MANAPNILWVKGGTHKTGRAGATLTIAYLLDRGTSGTLILATSTRKATIGISKNGFLSGDDASYHKGGQSTVYAGSNTVAAGDFLKVSSVDGVATTDGTSASTAQSADTFGVALEPKDADGYVIFEWTT